MFFFKRSPSSGFLLRFLGFQRLKRMEPTRPARRAQSIIFFLWPFQREAQLSFGAIMPARGVVQQKSSPVTFRRSRSAKGREGLGLCNIMQSITSTLYLVAIHLFSDFSCDALSWFSSSEESTSRGPSFYKAPKHTSSASQWSVNFGGAVFVVINLSDGGLPVAGIVALRENELESTNRGRANMSRSDGADETSFC